MVKLKHPNEDYFVPSNAPRWHCRVTRWYTLAMLHTLVVRLRKDPHMKDVALFIEMTSKLITDDILPPRLAIDHIHSTLSALVVQYRERHALTHATFQSDQELGNPAEEIAKLVTGIKANVPPYGSRRVDNHVTNVIPFRKP